MRCPKCGNEVGREEAFCGQCGTPNMPPARPTEMMNTSAPRSGLLSTYNTRTNNPNNSNTHNAPFTPTQQAPYSTGMGPAGVVGTGMAPQPMRYNTNSYAGTAHPLSGHLTQQPSFPATISQQSGFHQEATEAISLPFPTNNQVYPTAYPSPEVPGVAQQGLYSQPPHYSPFQQGNHAGPAYQQPTFVTGHGNAYNGRGQITPPPHKQRNGAVVAIVCICIVVTLLAVGGLGAVLLMRNHARVSNTPQTTPVASNAQTATPALSPTVVPSPTQTVQPTATPTQAITPTVTTITPTPPPADTGFSWCNQSCTNNGFQTEYPTGWTLNSTPSGNGLLFTPSTQPNIYAAFKLPGQTADTAQNILANDLQTNFGTKEGYTPPQSAPSTSTIAGETWVTSVISYIQNGQKERVAVYATVHQGRAYIIELQALDAQFDTVNNQYFVNMIGRFQFQPLPGQ